MKVLEQVADFHNTFQHPVLESPQIPNEARCKLRVSLLAEELKEFEQAIQDKDLVAAADALCDMQFVLAGAVLEFGMKEMFEDMFDEVYRSNMSKACLSPEEAESTIQAYKTASLMRTPPEMHYEEKDGKFLVYRTEDRKTLKSINYSPADLKQFINGE
jgi:predicted HAD superfamily Cof-like phosphohydrolase